MTPRLRRLGPRSMLAVMLAFLLLVPVLLASPASASSPKKLYGADISPHIPVPPAVEVAFTFTLTNESKSQMIGSANLTAPDGFTIPDQELVVLPRGEAEAEDNTIELGDLGLMPGMPGEMATLTFLATAASAPGVYTWLLDVRQANDFRGSGNSFTPDPANVHLVTTVLGPVACGANATCSGTVTDGTTTAEVNVDSSQTAAVLTITLLPTDAISCEGYTGTSATVDFNLTADDRTKTVTITLAADLVGDRSSEDFEVCYSSPIEETVTTRILPDCTFPIDIESVSTVPNNPPCVLSRTDNKDGSVSVSFFAPAGDPKGHI